ncbi:hypothetical protein NIIDNTM18_06670 [Mycolicibacterium litorale]|uniref:Amidohydrolase-related domain-containing protein n=1 Tax=Mycolicibacterium litorale TaxID=758802 RepID=A0A6S6NYY6_9MYCO|nr:amidohydrolase family protein [Mycolicibacterium litorale]BCI51389.1 hypothetical protein NIIDNTM18_06670 [Mycolicibacterium litorale]
MLIDTHHHLVPPGSVALYVPPGQEKATYAGRVRSWKPREAIEQMDSAGIAAAITSVVAAVGMPERPQELARLVRSFNEFGAEVVRDHPQRFGFLAGVPLPNVDAALEEISYALDDLKADGLCVFSSHAGIRLGDPRVDPVIAELDARRAVVLVHPTGSPMLDQLVPGLGVGLTELAFETPRTIASLLFNGVFHRYPKVRYIFPHGGGALPMLTERWNILGRSDERYSEFVAGGVEKVLGRYHYDVATVATSAMHTAVRTFAPPQRLLFGTDYPLLPIDITGSALKNVGISPDELMDLSYRNALNLFPRFVDNS